jgi:hypothetical protein
MQFQFILMLCSWLEIHVGRYTIGTRKVGQSYLDKTKCVRLLHFDLDIVTRNRTSCRFSPQPVAHDVMCNATHTNRKLTRLNRVTREWPLGKRYDRANVTAHGPQLNQCAS